MSYQRIDWIVIKKRTKNFHLCTKCTTIIIIFSSQVKETNQNVSQQVGSAIESYRQAFKTNEKLFYLYILIKRKEKRNDLMEKEEEGVRWKRMLINFRRWPGRKKRKRDGYPPIIASSFVFDSALRVYASSLH